MEPMTLLFHPMGVMRIQRQYHQEQDRGNPGSVILGRQMHRQWDQVQPRRYMQIAHSPID